MDRRGKGGAAGEGALGGVIPMGKGANPGVTATAAAISAGFAAEDTGLGATAACAEPHRFGCAAGLWPRPRIEGPASRPEGRAGNAKCVPAHIVTSKVGR